MQCSHLIHVVWSPSQLEVCFAVQLRRLDVANTALLSVVASRRKEEQIGRELLPAEDLDDISHDNVPPCEFGEPTAAHYGYLTIVRAVVLAMAHVVFAHCHHAVEEDDEAEGDERRRNAIRDRNRRNTLKNADLEQRNAAKER